MTVLRGAFFITAWLMCAVMTQTLYAAQASLKLSFVVPARQSISVEHTETWIDQTQDDLNFGSIRLQGSVRRDHIALESQRGQSYEVSVEQDDKAPFRHIQLAFDATSPRESDVVFLTISDT